MLAQNVENILQIEIEHTKCRHVYINTFCIITGQQTWEERASLGAFRTFVRFAHFWFCLFPLPLGVWEGLRFVIVALPGQYRYTAYNRNHICVV